MVKMDSQQPSKAVPVVQGAGLDQKWLETLPHALSKYQLQQLERRGWEVLQHRRVVNVQLDGRASIVDSPLIPFNTVT